MQLALQIARDQQAVNDSLSLRSWRKTGKHLLPLKPECLTAGFCKAYLCAQGPLNPLQVGDLHRKLKQLPQQGLMR